MAATCTMYDPRPTGASDLAHDDMTLVAACRRGEVSAFDELVKRYDRKLFRIAQHVTRNREDAQDVVQEAFLRAFRHLDQFQGNSQFSTWLVRITINQSLMKVRKAHRKKEVQVDQEGFTDTGELSLEAVDWAPNPEERYRASELRAILFNALETLQPGLSLVFVLRDVEGLSTEQTAAALGLTQAAVKTRLMRARLQLRDRLTPYFKNNVRNLARTAQN
ncbi:MAG TPA: sigma-70 family RNA polymerase sigma factor [Terriglobales bacterium]|nr:sigma-70 family RNA polymerase sigma factor [Terriglobales bacterium]